MRCQLVFDIASERTWARLAVPSSRPLARTWPTPGVAVQSPFAAEHERSWTVRSRPTRRRVFSIQLSIAEVLEHLQDEEQARGQQGGGTEQGDERGQDILHKAG